MSLHRPDIFQNIVKLHTEHLMRVKNIPYEEAEVFVKSILKERYKAPTISAIVQERPGYEVVKTISFNQFVKTAKDNIVCPNGRVYVNPKYKPARIREYIKDLLKRRSYHKKKMFAHQQKKEEELAAMEKANESRIKIDANTTTGGAKNSPYSCFYDKAGFNAVTAVARLMIKTNYSVFEQALGGNFFWKDMDELINNIMLRITHCPPQEEIMKIVHKYNLFIPTANDLMDRFQFFMNLYEIGPSYLYRNDIIKLKDDININSSYVNDYTNNDNFFNNTIKNLMNLSPIFDNPKKIIDLSSVERIVKTLKTHEIIFLYYVNNLRALFWKNSSVFKPLLKDMIDNSKNTYNNEYKASDLFTIDKDLTPIISTHFQDDVKGKELDKILEEEPILVHKFTNYLHYLNDIMRGIDDVFDLFFKTEIGTTRINIKDQMWRNTTLGSDTDSVIYTLKEWVKWFSGDVFDDSKEIDTILAIIGYYVAKIASHNTRLLSKHLGAQGDDLSILNMKGEYNFNSMVFYFIKKHYTGVMTIQEGRVLPDIKLDIKGLGLRGSHVPADVADKMQQFTIETQKRQAASHYIREVTGLEKEMAKDLRSGSSQFLKSISVKNPEQYANAEGTAYLYLQFWNEVFGEKYGQVFTPVKCPCVFLRPFNIEMGRYLQEVDKEIFNKLKRFISKYNRVIPAIIINPLLKSVPEEVLIMMDMRKHIYTNMKPLYLTLESFGMPLMHNHKNMLLLSDYYSELDLKLLASENEEGEE